MEYDPISSLEAVGYLEREAAFLYLVAVHSGYFLRRQYYTFAGRAGGTLFAHLLKKARSRKHIEVIRCRQGWHVYHLSARSIYEAFDRPNSQLRRIKSDGFIKSRLMVLDFVLANLHEHMLDSEAAKVEFFTTQCHVDADLLPQRHAGRWLYFPDSFPILIKKTGIPRFVFFDIGQETTTFFERYLRQYQPLFNTLCEFELTVVADNEKNSTRASNAFHRFLPEDKLRGVTPKTPLGVDHFLRYLYIRRQSEERNGLIPAKDHRLMVEGDGLYTTLEHEALYEAWRAEETTEEKIRQRFLQNSLRVSFSTVVLPYRYPVDGLYSQEAEGTPYQTPDETPSGEE